MTQKSSKGLLAEMGVWILGSFCIGLQGEDDIMLLIEFAGTSNSSKQMKDLLPHFVFLISGGTKGNQLPGSKFGIPCVSATEAMNWIEPP
jgi:hypothetical protein